MLLETVKMALHRGDQFFWFEILSSDIHMYKFHTYQELMDIMTCPQAQQALINLTGDFF